MGDRISIEYRKIDELIPYANNPRKNDKAVDAVAESIKEFGFKVPVIVDGHGEVIAGHTRIKAAKKLGMAEVPCILADDLTEQQIKAFRLADNKTAELADWDDDLLAEELSGIFDIDMELFGFDLSEDEDDKYTMKVNIPQYEVTGDKPNLADLLDTEKADMLIAEVEAAEGITDEERQFLIQAARRHNVFNYRNVAEYYAQATPEMQRLMERSALVIIDVDNAIANGYARLAEDIQAMLDEAKGDADDA